MQESLFNTVSKLQKENKINVEELEVILNSDIEEVVALCKKASLKPKTDSMGNAFFTKSEVDTLKKLKELYSQSQEKQPELATYNILEHANKENINLTNNKINFLERAKARVKTDNSLPTNNSNVASMMVQNHFAKMENSLISKMSAILSEKMDGFDEIIVELIRSKTENENLRQQVNSLNKQNYILKNELASYKPVAFGLYTKKDTPEL